MVNDMANMVFGVWREKLNSNAVLSAMMVVFAQFLIIKIFDGNVSKNKETNENPSSCRSMNVPNTQPDPARLTKTLKMALQWIMNILIFNIFSKG